MAIAKPTRQFRGADDAFRWSDLKGNPLFWGVVASVLLHILLLAMKFSPPEPIVFKPKDSQLEVVLLNAETDTKPKVADVLAQVNMEGGGDRDKGRAKSPLPADTKAEDGDDLMKAKQRQQQLECSFDLIHEPVRRDSSAVKPQPEKPTHRQPTCSVLCRASGSWKKACACPGCARLQALAANGLSHQTHTHQPRRL